MSDPYAQIGKGKLSFKNDKIKLKKKKKSKDAEKLDEKKLSLIKDPKLAEELIKLNEDKKINKDVIEQIAANKEFAKPELTKAELAFRNRQDKMQAERVLKKASKSHKQRVEEFNAHLNDLSEHYECAKVSWTK